MSNLRFKNRKAIIRYLAAKYGSDNIYILRQKMKAKDVKMIWNYRAEGMTIGDVRSEVLKIYRYEIEPLRQKRENNQDIDDPIQNRETNYVLNKQEAYKLVKLHFYQYIAQNSKALRDLPSSIQEQTIIRDNDRFFRFRIDEYTDWDYYAKSYRFPKVMKRRSLESIVIPPLEQISSSYVHDNNLTHKLSCFSVIDTEVVKTVRRGSAQKGIQVLLKRVHNHPLVKITASYVDRYRYYKKYLHRFELMDLK